MSLRFTLVLFWGMSISPLIALGQEHIAPVRAVSSNESAATLDSMIQTWKVPVFSFLSNTGPLEPAKAALEIYKTTVSEALAQRRFLFSMRDVPNEYKAAFNGLNITLHRILPDQATNLGRLATTLESRYGVELIYSPMMLELVGGLGTFIELPERSMLIVTSDTIFSDSYANHSNGHEMIHMKFWAFRKGLQPDFLPNAPVHASYQSEQAINSSATIGIYQNYMSFEELVTFAFNVSRKADALAAAPADERLNSELRFEIEKMKVVSENAIAASEKAITALQTQSARRLSYPGELAGAFFEISESGSNGFTLRIFLSNEEQEQCGTDCRGELVGKLTNTVKLAKYNLAHFPSGSMTDGLDFKTTMAFEEAQRAFIENLK